MISYLIYSGKRSELFLLYGLCVWGIYSNDFMIVFSCSYSKWIVDCSYFDIICWIYGKALVGIAIF